MLLLFRFLVLEHVVELSIGRVQIGRVKESRLFEAQVDECGLHARKHCVDAAFVYVAHAAPGLGAFYHHLDEFLLFEDRDACFVKTGVNYDFSAHSPP